MTLDPFSGLATFAIGLVRTHRLNEWAKLCFAMAWSYSTAFSFAAGTALVAHQPPTSAFGAGMIAGAGAVTFLFARSPLTHGLMVAAPRDLLIAAESQEIVSVQPK